MPPQTLRIIDANCNRISEGLRFLEDVARFVLNDATSSQKLREMRHNLVKNMSQFGAAALSERNSEADVGISIEAVSEQHNLPSLVTANAKRVEEALRVLEEIAKLPEISPTLNSNDFKRARFNIYTFERELSSKILRHHKITQLTGLYVILDTQTLGMKDEVDAASAVIRGGARIIQLRDKHHSKGALLAIAQKLKDLCCESGTLFLINDHLDVALAVDADGLHIGQDDLPLSTVRQELPIDKVIGCSAANLTQALKAEAEGADYIAVGSVFPTATKKDATVIGLEHLRQIKQAITIPLIAIGGINKDNITEVMTAGANSAAVISAVLIQENIEAATRQLVTKIE